MGSVGCLLPMSIATHPFRFGPSPDNTFTRCGETVGKEWNFEHHINEKKGTIPYLLAVWLNIRQLIPERETPLFSVY